MPPSLACQNCPASITAAEQLSSVPRFFWAGHNARLTHKAVKAAITGMRNTVS